MLRGQVVDVSDKAPIPYTDILIKGTGKGAITNDSGYFKIAVTHFPITLVVSFVGYETKETVVHKGDNNLVVKIKERINQLDEVVIRPSENPAHTILKKVVKRKKLNNPDDIKSYHANNYRRTLWQLKNIDSSVVEGNAVLRSLKKSMVRQNDSVTRYTIPVLFSEEVKKDVYSYDPYYSYSIPELERKEGLSVLENGNLFSDYASMFTEKVNFYNDNFLLNKVPVVNPISLSALGYYQFRLTPDTVYDLETGLRLYHIKFLPKNKRDAVFDGDMTIYDSIFAIKSIQVKLPPTSNVPFIIGYTARVDYMLLRDNTSAEIYRPFVRNSTLSADFHFLKFKDDKARACANISIVNRYSDVELHPSMEEVKANEEQVFAAKKISDVEMKQQRRDSLSTVEKDAIIAMRELNNIGWIKFTNQAAVVLGSGYYNVGKIDIGPYAEIFKLNGAEGLRLNAPLRTSDTFHPNFFADGMVGYGCKDGKFKGSLDMGWKFNTQLRSVVKVGGEYNSFRVGGNESHFALLRENALVLSEDLLWFSVFAAQLDDKYTTRYGGYVGYEREWTRWLLSNITLSNYNIESSQYTPFTHNGTAVDVFNQQEVSLRLRISSNKEVHSDFYARRIYINNAGLPIVSPVLTVGSYDLRGIGQHGYYAKLHLAVKQSLTLGTTQLNYALEGGAIFGAVPFPLLEGHRSMESFMFAKYKFNLLYNLALVSDRYASLLLEYNLNGLIFNRIPFIRSLNLKEMLNCKILYNFMDAEKHAKVLDMPDYIFARNSAKPYVELGCGIQNIFQVMGVGCVWRVPVGDPVDVPYAYTNFSVVVKFSLSS